MNMLVLAAIIAAAYFTVIYGIAMLVKNAGIVDIGWGFGFVILSWVGFFRNVTVPSLIFYVLVSFWGLRLTYHIFKRNVGKPEDFRYANFRKKWGKTYYVRSYFQVFLFQALLMFAIALPFIYGQQAAAVSGWGVGDPRNRGVGGRVRDRKRSGRAAETVCSGPRQQGQTD